MALKATFHDLPVEILQHVLSLTSLFDRYALQNTSKHLQWVTQPTLYRHLRWKFNNWELPSITILYSERLLWQRIQKPYDPSRRPGLHLLLRRLLQQPEIGCMIETIDFKQVKTPHTIWSARSAGKPELTDDDLKLLAERGRSITGSQEEDWFTELKIGNYDAYVTILLSYCTNLKKLILQNSFYYCGVWKRDKMHLAPNYANLWNVILSLQKLEEIDCDQFGRTEIPWDSKRIPLLFQLPQISSIKLSLVDMEIYTKFRWNFPIFTTEDGTKILPSRSLYSDVRNEHGVAIDVTFPDASTVPCTIDSTVKAPHLKTLVLYRSHITEAALKRIVGTAPNLTSLTVELYHNPFRTYLDPVMDGPAVRDALTANLDDDHKSSALENLAIRCIWNPEDYGVHIREEGQAVLDRNGSYRSNLDSHMEGRYGPKGSIGSLKHLVKLQRLEVAAQFFLGWYPDLAPPLHELIPDSLTHITFRHDYMEWNANLTGGWGSDDYVELFNQYVRSETTGNLQSVKMLGMWGWANGSFPREPEDVYVPKVRRACENAGLTFEYQRTTAVECTTWLRGDFWNPTYSQKVQRELHGAKFDLGNVPWFDHAWEKQNLLLNKWYQYKYLV